MRENQGEAFDKIIIGEDILSASDDDVCLRKFREEIAYCYFYRDRVHLEAPKNGAVIDLVSFFPQYVPYIENLDKNVSIMTERFKHSKPMAPLFNGSGCHIL